MDLVDRHLAACEPCRREMEGLRATIALLKGTPVASPSRSFLVQAEKKPRPRPAPPLWQPVPVPVIISLLLTLALFMGDILNALPYSSERTAPLAPPSLTSPMIVSEGSPDAAAVVAPSPTAESPAPPKAAAPTGEAPRAKALTEQKAPAAANAGGAVSPPAPLRGAPSTTEAGGGAVQAPQTSERPVPQPAPLPQLAPSPAPSALAAPLPTIPLPQPTALPSPPSQTPVPELKIGKPLAEGVPSAPGEQAPGGDLPAAGPAGNFFVMPWRLIEVGLLILSTVVIAVTILIRKRRRKEINSF